MSLSDLIAGFLVTAFFYTVLAMGIHGGTPPFYRRSKPYSFLEELDQSDEIDGAIYRALPFVFGIILMVGLFAYTRFFGFLIATGIIAIWPGLRLRQDLARSTDGPLNWVTNPWPSHPFYTLTWTVRWPMLVFDLWTLGLSVGFGLMIAL